jgi:hypothetical protein
MAVMDLHYCVSPYCFRYHRLRKRSRLIITYFNLLLLTLVAHITYCTVLYFKLVLQHHGQPISTTPQYEYCNTHPKYGGGGVLSIGIRHIPQLIGNGREDGKKGDNQQKSGVRRQILKKRGHDFAARRAKGHAAMRSSRAEDDR